jgi:hypothetical protein
MDSKSSRHFAYATALFAYATTLSRTPHGGATSVVRFTHKGAAYHPLFLTENHELQCEDGSICHGAAADTIITDALGDAALAWHPGCVCFLTRTPPPVQPTFARWAVDTVSPPHHQPTLPPLEEEDEAAADEHDARDRYGAFSRGEGHAPATWFAAAAGGGALPASVVDEILADWNAEVLDLPEAGEVDHLAAAAAQSTAMLLRAGRPPHQPTVEWWTDGDEDDYFFVGHDFYLGSVDDKEDAEDAAGDAADATNALSQAEEAVSAASGRPIVATAKRAAHKLALHFSIITAASTLAVVVSAALKLRRHLQSKFSEYVEMDCAQLSLS